MPPGSGAERAGSTLRVALPPPGSHPASPGGQAALEGADEAWPGLPACVSEAATPRRSHILLAVPLEISAFAVQYSPAPDCAAPMVAGSSGLSVRTAAVW